jgi:hypothetical protein
MKKIILSAYIAMSTTVLVAETYTPDSATVVDTINTVGNVVAHVAPPKYSQLAIVVTGFLSSVATLIFAFINKRKTISKWEREGKLITKETNL